MSNQTRLCMMYDYRNSDATYSLPEVCSCVAVFTLYHAAIDENNLWQLVGDVVQSHVYLTDAKFDTAVLLCCVKHSRQDPWICYSVPQSIQC